MRPIRGLSQKVVHVDVVANPSRGPAVGQTDPRPGPRACDWYRKQLAITFVTVVLEILTLVLRVRGRREIAAVLLAIGTLPMLWSLAVDLRHQSASAPPWWTAILSLRNST